MKEKTPTIEDVARHAHVSTATVSRALSLPDRVSEATRLRVAEAVSATGYTINQSARSLRMRAARTILIALPNIGNPFYSTVLDGVVHEAATRGYGVLVANRVGADHASWLRDYFLSNRADGLLLFDGSLDPRAFSEMDGPRGAFPIVFCADEDPGPNLNAVLTDNMEAGGRATRHLIDLGHKRIGHLHGPSKNGLPAARLIGYATAMAEAGLSVDPDWIIDGAFDLESGYAAGERFCAMPNRPTAMFCANDEMALGFLASIKAHGLDCPRDVSVVGFDDISVARFTSPALTTMQQPREEMGRIATSILLDILDNPDRTAAPQRIVLASEIVVRQSTARLDGMVTPA